MLINDRILEIISMKGLSRQAFCNAVGVQPQTLHHIVAGRRTKPSFDVLEKIVITYPEINPTWLITGKGPVLLPLYAEAMESQSLNDVEAAYGRRFQILEKRIEKIEDWMKKQ